LAVYSLTLPHTPAPAKGTPVQFRDLLCADAFALLKTRHFLIFSLCATLISIPLGTYYAYTASYLADAGIADVSTAMSFGQMSEIFFMLVIPLLFRRLGVKYMLLIGMAAWFVRYAFFALGVSEEGASCSISASCCTACAMTFSLLSALSIPTAWPVKK
jgi:Na+/melibiose symporter-like transporter